MRLLARGVWFTPARRLLTSALVLVAFLSCGITAGAVSPDDVVRVEEDWELVVGEPEPTTAAPQVTSVISPTGDLESWHVAFELNHQTLPSYEPGGLALQLWCGADSQGVSTQKHGAVLSQGEGEQVQWTQSMSLAAGVLTFEITNGASTTWEEFGGGGHLSVSTNTSLEHLGAYQPEVSVANSGVGFASNRVESFVLKRVRLHRANGAVQELNVDLTVNELE
jgi:hypothetical protein